MSSDSKASKTGGKQGTRAPSGPQERTLRDMRTGRTKKDSARTQEDAERQRLLTLPPLYSTVQQSTVHSTAKYSTIQQSTVQYSKVQYSTAGGQTHPDTPASLIKSPADSETLPSIRAQSM